MILLIYNPVSGMGDNDLENILELLNSNDKEYVLVQTEDDNTIKKLFSEEVLEYSAIIVVGGDGTVSQVIEAIVNNNIDVDLIVYPKGTSNEYAASLGVSKLTLSDYLQHKTSLLEVDLGRYGDDGVFTYSFVFGNFSHVPYETPQWLKNRLGYIAYWLYAFVTLYIFRLKRYKMRFEFNDKVVDGNFLFGSISNSETLGKVIRLNDVSFSDGLMEVFLVKAPGSLRELTRFLHDARTGNDTSGLIIREKVSYIGVNSPKKHSWSADGEYSGTFSSLSISVKEKAIRVVV